MPFGTIVAQAGHAARRSAPGNSPLEDDTHVVVLAVAGEDELLLVHERLVAAGVAHVLVREPDPPFLGAATAIGVPPQPRENVRPHLKRLPLLKE
jgi:hypothetical protein